MLRHKLFRNKQQLIRSKEIFRIEALSDAVFAISVSLLIMSLEVPRTYAELKLIIRQFLPFLATVSMVFFIWWQQNKFFRQYGLDDSRVRLLNLCLLIVTLFYVFPLKFLFTILFSAMFGINYFETVSQESVLVIAAQDFPQLIVFFSLGYAMVWLIFYMMYAYVRNQKLNPGLMAHETIRLKSDKRDAMVQVFIGCSSALAGFFQWPFVSQLIFLLIPVWLVVNFYLTSKAMKSGK